MIIKELELTNIRSHGHSLIRFPAGRTLLEGDIGSGKSSVLMGIEFALFGLGSDTGSSILKLGQDAGEVRMSFEVDGEGYEVTRRLERKAGRVQQTDGYLKAPGETLNLSPSELKEKVLEVLEFNEVPDPKAQSWIFRYAVYTPQEEMKSILTLAPEQRLQILRRAFRVEDYKTAATNAEEAARKISKDATRLDGISEGVDQLREEVIQLEEQEQRLREEFQGLEASEASAAKLVAEAKGQRERVQERELSLQGAKSEREHYERVRSESTKDAAEFAREAKAARARLAEAETALKAKSPGTHGPKSLDFLRRRERALDAKARKLTGIRAAVESKLSDYVSIMKSGVCPVCDRPLDAHDFEQKRTGKDAELNHVSDELHAVENELAEARKRVEEAKELAAEKRESVRRRQERSRLKGELARKEAGAKKFEKRVAFAKGMLEQLTKKIQELENVAEERKDAEKKLAQAERAHRDVRDDLTKTKERLEGVQKQQTRIAIEIVAKEDASNKSWRLKEREIWLEDYFVPTVRAVEKSVLASINQEFDALFKKWFGILVVDQDKEVSVDEDFSPVVSQGGYEQDVRYLSGGERTSVALAYRLALNMLAQRVSLGMKSNLLILDEPTDGFSKEQMGNVREVLDEVGSPQVIIVSHDKELESFADQIFRVEKTKGESAVRMP